VKTLRRTFRLTLGIAALALLSGCTEPGEPQARAEARFETCVPCHGQSGQGLPELEAPPIAGLPAWYVEAQLTKFRGGIRGTHPEDLAGMRMQPLSRTLPTDDDVRDVAAYVATLPPPPIQELALGGNIARGQALYGTCMACHGFDGAGNEALKAPAIAGHPDWYVYAQLHKFKIGARGAHPQDVSGALMRPMAMTLDEQGMKDVAAYTWSMARK
jgi:cytochrome c553